MQSDYIIHFPHVPKCGGSSFRKGLQEAYGEGLHLYYRNPIRWNPPKRRAFPIWKFKNKVFPERVPESTRIVYGHFCFDDAPASLHKQVKKGVFLREPIEWVGSFYSYLSSKHKDMVPSDPIEVIKYLDLQNGFQKYLGRTTITDLDFVGLAEQYQPSLDLFEAVFSKKIEFYVENKTDANRQPARENFYKEQFSSMGVLDEIKRLMENNQKIYAEATQRFRLLLAEHGLNPAR